MAEFSICGKALIPEMESLYLRSTLMDEKGSNNVNGRNSTLGKKGHERIGAKSVRELCG